MLIDKLFDGLKSFYKQNILSDRTLKIVEINEDFSPTSRNLKRTATFDINEDNESPNTTKKIKFSNEVCNEECHCNIENIDNDENDAVNKSSEDVLVNRIEEDENGGTCFLKIPVHSIILYLNSAYFQKLFVGSGMKETNENVVTVKVNKGEGKYLELLIQAFYDQEILATLSLPDLLSVLDVAARFSCMVFVERGLELLDECTVKSVEECDTILKCVSRVFESFDTNEKFESTKQSCVRFICDQFFPLEFKFEQQVIFTKLHYYTVLHLLKSNYTIAENESALFILMYRWLTTNEEYQTPDIIHSFLTTINYEALELTFLTDELTVCDKVLIKWDGYSQWFVNALKFHSLSSTSRSVRNITTSLLSCRENYSTCANKNSIFKSLQLQYLEDDKKFSQIDHVNLIWNGVCFQSEVVVKKTEQENRGKLMLRFIKTNEFNPQESITKFYQSFEVYVCLLPGYLQFRMAMLKEKNFIRKQVRRVELIFQSDRICTIKSIAKMDDAFQKALEKDGINLTLFFKRSSFAWLKFENITKTANEKPISFCGNRNFSKFNV